MGGFFFSSWGGLQPLAATVGPFGPSFVFSGEKNVCFENILAEQKCLAKNYFLQLAVDSWQVSVGRWRLAGGSWQGIVSRWQVEGGMWPNCLGAVIKAGTRCLHQPLG